MAVLLYLVLALIGVGPTLYLCRAKLRDAGTWLVAPVVGFVLMAILSTVLVQLQFPVQQWATLLTVVLILLSLGLTWMWSRRRRVAGSLALLDCDSPVAGSEAALWGGLALGIGGLLAVLPVQIGGWWFSHARGNVWDAYNYAQMAGALGHEPIKWLLHSDLATLTSQCTIYAQTTALLQTRWTSSAVFAWAAGLTRMHLFDLEPQHYVLHLLLAIGPAYLLARRLGAGPRWSFVAAMLLIDCTLADGRRASAASCYLTPALSRRNLTVITRAQATRILIENGRAVGAEYASKGQRHEIRSEREVILCGGSVNSPQLLLLSGIGPASEIGRHGIKTVHDLPGVGKNLQDHLHGAVKHYCTKPVSLYSIFKPTALPRHILHYLLTHKGRSAFVVGVVTAVKLAVTGKTVT